MGKNGRLSVKIQPFRPGFTDKCSKKRLVSVNPHHNVQKFTDKSPENAGLSVKCVLLTDKPSKMCSLSVNLNEILAESVEQYCCLKKVVFIHWELKVPDKVSRKSTVFVRLFVKFKTEKRLSPSLFLVVKSPK